MYGRYAPDEPNAEHVVKREDVRTDRSDRPQVDARLPAVGGVEGGVRR